MASMTTFSVFIVAVLALFQNIEAWLPPYFPGYNPGYTPGFNPYVPGLPFVPGLPGAPPPYYDDKGVTDPSLASSLNGRTEPLGDRRHCSDPSSMSPAPPTPFFGSPLGALNPINWLFRKWPTTTWNIPPVNTQYYNTGNGNGWSKLKTWSWSF